MKKVILSFGVAVLLTACMVTTGPSDERTKAASAAFNHYLAGRNWAATGPVTVYIRTESIPWEDLVRAYPGKSVAVTFQGGEAGSISPKAGARSEILTVKVMSLRGSDAVAAISWVAGSTGVEGHVYELKKKDGRWAITREIGNSAG